MINLYESFLKYKNKLFLYFIFFTVFILSSILRLPKPSSENWLNSDATYHMLLTLKAYDETPLKQHKFLPIVSLGNKDDKNIPWGATIPDKNGNFYYTSFMPLGFIIPYLFIKIFSLPTNEYSLYIFNTSLFFLCWIFCTHLFIDIFQKKINSCFILTIITMIYLFSMETMQSHGIVYWPHSLFQLIFIIQCICFLKLKNKTIYKTIFLSLLLIAPLIEWTGYISNFGFLIALSIRNKLIKSENKKIFFNLKVFLQLTLIPIISILSFVIFTIHSLSILDKRDFTRAVLSRFLARSINGHGDILQLIKGYQNSYMLIIILVGLLLTIILINSKKRKIFLNEIKNNATILIIMFFPLIENILMREHAIVYSYDRLKGILPLLLIIFISISTIIKKKTRKNIPLALITFTIILISISNFYVYTKQNNYYRWKENDNNSNILLIEYIKKQYNHENSILSQFPSVRGYTNIVFNRGVFERTSEGGALNITKKLNKRYAVYLEPEIRPWEKYYYNKATIYDTKNSSKTTINTNQNSLVIKTTPIEIPKLTTSNLSDYFWLNGVSRTENTLLFTNYPEHLNLLQKSTFLKYKETKAKILSINLDQDSWIRVIIDGNKEVFAYPNIIETIK